MTSNGGKTESTGEVTGSRRQNITSNPIGTPAYIIILIIIILIIIILIIIILIIIIFIIIILIIIILIIITIRFVSLVNPYWSYITIADVFL